MASQGSYKYYIILTPPSKPWNHSWIRDNSVCAIKVVIGQITPKLSSLIQQQLSFTVSMVILAWDLSCVCNQIVVGADAVEVSLAVCDLGTSPCGLTPWASLKFLTAWQLEVPA